MDTIYILQTIISLFIRFSNKEGYPFLLLIMEVLLGETGENILKQYGGRKFKLFRTKKSNTSTSGTSTSGTSTSGTSTPDVSTPDTSTPDTSTPDTLTQETPNTLSKENINRLKNKSLDKSKSVGKLEAKRALNPLLKMKSGFSFDEERARKYRDKNKRPFMEKIMRFVTIIFMIIVFPLLPFYYVMKGAFTRLVPLLRSIIYSM